MPIIKSAKKRVRVAKKATARNSRTKRNFREAIKVFEAAASQKTTKAPAALNQAQSTIDTAVKKGLLHRKTAARKKSRLALIANLAGIKRQPATAKKTASKSTAKKTAPVKKTVVKKAKKTTPKPKK